MPKRYKRSKRRSRSRKKPKNTILKNVRYFKHKLTAVGSLEVLPGYQTASLVISRYDFQGVVANVLGINTPSRWAAVKKNYEQYAVTGCKLEYFPTNDVGVPGSFTIQNIFFYEDLDTYDVSNFDTEQILALETFRSLSTNRRFRVYRNNKPLAK